MPGSGFDLCIKCNSGGKMLVCNGDDCPIVVHEKCMGCKASYDVSGKFDCPYCMSRIAYVELNQAREDVMLKKRALSFFIDAKMIDRDKEKESIGNDKRKRKSRFGEADNVENSDQLEGDKEQGSDSLCRGRDGLLLDERNDVSMNRQGNGNEAMDLVDNVAFNVNDVGRGGEDEVCRRGDDLVELCGSPSVQEEASEGENDDLKSCEENENRGKSHGKTASENENNSIVDIGLGGDEGGGSSDKISKENNPLLRKSKRIKRMSTSEPPSSKVSFSGRSSPSGKSPRKTKKSIAPSKVKSPCEPPSSNVDCAGRSSPRIRKSPRKTKPPSKVKSSSETSSPNVDSAGTSSPRMRKSPRKTKKTNSAGEVSEKVSNPGGRKRLLWTEEEEEMIKKGVEKYTSEDNKNIPWRNILEFGRHVFQSSRLPQHLKDKWRTMLAKENSAK